MSRLMPVFEPLDRAADQVIAISTRGGIREKRQILDALADGVGFLGNAVVVMGSDLCDAGYSPGITDPVYTVGSALRLAARQCAEALRVLDSLLNTPIGDLAPSGQQVPHHSELNGGA